MSSCDARFGIRFYCVLNFCGNNTEMPVQQKEGVVLTVSKEYSTRLMNPVRIGFLPGSFLDISVESTDLM